MKSIYLAILAIIVLMAAASASYAGVIHEDVAYWWQDGGKISTEFNPSTAWLTQHLAAGNIRVKVQQTVYDQASAHAMLARNGDGNRNGYLYAYSVTNINWGDAADLSDNGIVGFQPDWDTAPTYVTLSKQTPTGWAVDSSSPAPAWKWTGTTDPGILPGETVGGFWAVSNVSADGEVNAHGVRLGGLERELMTGRTTGPVPDPSCFASLLTGLAGLGALRLFRRK